MGKKLNKVYEALVSGAADGLTGDALYAHVKAEFPKASSKRIVKASLFALSDPDVKDRGVLEAIYALAIKYRLSSLGVEDDVEDSDDDDTHAPAVSQELKNKLETSVSAIPTLIEETLATPTAKSVH